MATILERRETLAPQKPIRKPAMSAQFFWAHIAGMVIFGALTLILTVLNIVFLFQGHSEATTEKVVLPDYDYSVWRGLMVQDRGRLKPFESAAKEMALEIHGRERVLGNNAVAVVLGWMLQGNPKATERASQWDETKFIRCEHRDVRKLILLLEKDGSLKDGSGLTYEQIHGKYFSPKELKEFRAIYMGLEQTRPARLRELTSQLPRPAGEQEFGAVMRRLSRYEALRHPAGTQTGAGPMAGEGSIPDSFAFVALDRVPGAPLFTIGQLMVINQDPDQWFKQIKERVKDVPQLYLSQEHKDALQQFEKKLAANDTKGVMDELKQSMRARRDKEVNEYVDLRSAKKDKAAAELLVRELLTWPDLRSADQEKKLLGYVANLTDAGEQDAHRALMFYRYGGSRKEFTDLLQTRPVDAKAAADVFGDFLAERDKRLVDDLDKRLPKPGQYSAGKPENRMLHLVYLETRYPDLYRQAMNWQPPPVDGAKRVLTSFTELSEAYDSGNGERFAAASNAFFATVRQVSEQEAGVHYPGDDTVLVRVGRLVTGESIAPPAEQLLNLELLFNRIKPFMWAWILMLPGLILFGMSLLVKSRAVYIAGFVFYAASLAFQLFGFFTRIIVSGRPPVTNMYETVIWVAFMTGVFALVLESIYRRKVIALAGALVATLGLVLADQMPLALDPKINPLVPVLRSNFWLTIHVLTIVSSYAAGALAWALGNIALVMIVFGRGGRDTIKMLSNFTYRALQIAVLLLAAGTFLGGWWAAYSWGRFWGWDPKETGALIALLCYVIPLHMRFIGWIKDFGLAVAGIVCFAAIMISWYGVNFVFPAGLHSYGFGGGGDTWVYWAASLNLAWVFAASFIYREKQSQPQALQVA